jgi:predicted Zn-dependent protease
MRHRLGPVLHLLLLSFLTSGCGLLEWKDKLLDVLVDRIPPEMEASLGQQILPSVLPSEATLRDAVLQRQLEGLLEPLLEKNAITQPKIRIYISREPALNAFAIPGGILIFNAGMLRASGSPEEILGVAAHEIAHATERHVVKSMIQSLSLAAIVSFFLGDISGLGAYILHQSQMLLQNGFSRTQEAQADEVGFRYLVQAGVDPRGMSRFFERIRAQKGELEAQHAEGQKLERMNALFSTHPLTQDRIRWVEERFAGLSSQEKAKLRPVRFDLKAFQARLNQVVVP